MNSSKKTTKLLLVMKKWVPSAESVKISSTNIRLETTVPQKEETFQVVIDIIKNSTCFKDFTISADFPKIFMQQFCYTIKKVQDTDSYEFLLANKKCTINAEVFRTILDICPTVEGVDFTDVLDDDTALTFLIDLGYKGLLNRHTNMLKFVRIGEDYQEYRLPIPDVMLTDAIKHAESSGNVDVSEESEPGPEPAKKKTSSKRRVKKKATLSADDNIISDDPDVALELAKSISQTKFEEAEAARKVHATYARIVSESVPESSKKKSCWQSSRVLVISRSHQSTPNSKPATSKTKLKGAPSLTPQEQEAADIMQALKESKKTRRRQPGTKGSNEGTGSKPGVPDESTNRLCYLNEFSDDDNNDVEKDDKDSDADDEGDDHVSDTQDADDETESDKVEDYLCEEKVTDAAKEEAEKTSEEKDDAKKTELPPSSSSLSVSSGFGDQFLKLSSHSSLVSIVKDSADTNVPVSVILETTNLPPIPEIVTETIVSIAVPLPQVTPIISTVYQTPTPILTPPITTDAPTIITAAHESDALSTVELRVAKLEKDVSELRTVDHSSQALAVLQSQVLMVVDSYLDTKVRDVFQKELQKHMTDLIHIYSLHHFLELTKKPTPTDEQEYEKSPLDILKIKKEQAESKKEAQFHQANGTRDYLKRSSHIQGPHGTPIDFSKYVLNGLKIENLTQDILLGPAFNLLKGTSSSSIELEYNFQECFNALTDKLDWNNPEGEYLKTSDPEVTYITSITKTKAARYEIKRIEYMVHTLWSTIKHAYDKDTLMGIKHWGERRKLWYRSQVNKFSKQNVYSTKAILGVKSVSVKKLHGYGHLEEIMVKRSDQQLYKFKEGDFVHLHLDNIEDMLLLAVQHKLFHLDGNVIVDFIVALRMFTRSLILKRCVEDLQLGVKSYQKKLNITKPDVSLFPAGSVVPTGKDNSIVSTGSTKVIPAGITNLWNIVLKEKKKEKDREEIQKKYYVLHPVLIEETYAVQRETKARTILLQSLPEDHMADFHHLDDARDIWLAVKARFGGNDESKKKRKSMLKQEFLEFRVSESEGLHKGYDRFQKISSQLNQMQAKPDNEDSNMKFLRALPPSWSQVAITLKTKGGLDYLSFDDLYNKLRTLEIDVKGGSSYDSRGTSAPTHSAFISAASTNQDITYEILIQNWENGFGRELDIKWQMAMLSVRINRFEKKAGRKMKFNNKDAARYFHFKLKEWIRQKTKALLSVDSNVKLGHDHEGKEWKNLLGDVSDGCFYDADELPHGSKFGLGFGETFGSDEVFDPSGPSIFDTTPEDVQRNLSMTDQRTIDFDPVFQVFKAPIKLRTNEPLASAPSSVDFKTMTETADQQPSSTKDNPSFSFKENVKPPRNLCNKSGVNSRSLCKRKSFGSKTCFVCGSKFHLIKDCDFYEKQLALHNKPMWTNVANIPSFVPKAASVLAGSRNRPSSVPAGSRNRPSSVPAGSMNKPISVPAGRRNRPTFVPAGRTFSAVKALSRLFLENSKAKYAMGIQEQWWISSIYMENPHKNRDLGIVDSGCSRSMTGNKEKLDDFVKIVGGNVTFGGGDGKITGKGTIRTSKLNFENVYYVEELQNFNLFSVSQICDTKHKVLFTDKECLVLSKEFQLPENSQVVLRVPRRNNLYCFNLSDIKPERGVTCLLAKASLEESTKWHRRMAHVNFKNMNKLVALE
ncbi:hypothetical protein Tco_0039825 [Tanacetum coccineum]